MPPVASTMALARKTREIAAFAVVAEGARDAVAVLQQRRDRVFHVDLDALVDAVVLQGADHLQTGAIADVGQARIAVAAEVALQDLAVLGAVEHRAPGFQLAHAARGFLGVQLGHAPVVDVLPAAHGVGEVHAPGIAVIDVGHGRGHSAFGHDGVGLAQQGFADQAHRRPEAEASMAARNPAPPAPMTMTSCSCV